MFLPVQLAAAKALSLGADWYESVNAVYRKRREKAYELLDLVDCVYDKGQAGMFVWARIPDRYTDSYVLSDEVLQGANVFITPGGIFGTGGDRFVRISLCSPENKIQEAIERIMEMKKIKG
jgi:aspartate/methionine/tyrosine aminotransferase